MGIVFYRVENERNWNCMDDINLESFGQSISDIFISFSGFLYPNLEYSNRLPW